MTTTPVEARRRRGRPTSPERTEQTERAIREAACDLFLEKGFAETRVEDVASRAGVAKGTLYLYHPTKTALLEAVLKAAIADPVVAVSRMQLDPGETVQGYLRRRLVPLLRDVETGRQGDLIRLILSDAARFPELAAIYRRLVIEPMTAFLRLLAQRARAGGELRADSDALERFPLLLMAPGLMATAWNGLHGPDERISAAEAFEAMLDLVFTSAPRPPEP